MPIILLNGIPITYQIARNPRRKRLGLEISPDGHVIVRAPSNTPHSCIEDLLRQAERWLFETLTGLRQTQPRSRSKPRQVEDAEGPVPYSLTRQRGRRRITIYVHPGAEVQVRAPMNASVAEIEDFVRSKADWIRRQQTRLENVAAPTREYVTGETLLYQGEEHALQVDSGLFEETRVELKGKTLRVQVGPARDEHHRRLLVRHALHRWLVERALEQTRERLPHWAERLGVSFRKATIKDLKSRWGSCSHNGNISISFRIIMAPPGVMDYLFIHELCHLVHPNHSEAYWKMVARLMPEHKKRRKWLRDHEAQMVL